MSPSSAITAMKYCWTMREREIMNKEYLVAKANLCQELALEQITAGNEEEGVENLKRMIRALNEINMINYLEERGRGR
jgi:hypothetical protein